MNVYNFAIGNSCRKDIINVSRERNMCSMIKKKGYRLPTRNEWVYAMQGGTKSAGTKFSGSNNLDEVAWTEETSMADVS